MKTLDIWQEPELPIVIDVDDEEICQLPSVTHVISVLKQHDRVCKISICGVPNSLLEELATMSEPFPALIELELVAESFQVNSPTLPDSFLGGSVPRLRSLDLCGISFPGMGNLLLSTRDLVALSLGAIPPSGHISPDSMVTILSRLTRLKSLDLHVQRLPTAIFWTHGASLHPPALSRVVLPALTNLTLSGDSGYLEDIVSRIDAPLECLAVAFEKLVFDIPPLYNFISFIGCTQILNASHRVVTSFSNYDARISLFRRKGDVDFKVLYLEIQCGPSGSRLSWLAQACNSLFLTLPSLEHLGIYKSEDLASQWQHEVELTQWMELLRPFIAVKDLVLDEQAVSCVSSTLQELVGNGVTEILPALQNIFLEDFPSSSPVPEGIGVFVAARELSGHPIIVHHRKKKQ